MMQVKISLCSVTRGETFLPWQLLKLDESRSWNIDDRTGAEKKSKPTGSVPGEIQKSRGDASEKPP
jgi:hypothetical protein